MAQTRSRIEAAPLGRRLVSWIVAEMITRDRKWVGTLPPGLEASATVDALRAICALDLMLRTIQMIQLTSFLAFPAKAGIHFCRGHRLSPVKRD
jgi:hypothetical protein